MHIRVDAFVHYSNRCVQLVKHGGAFEGKQRNMGNVNIHYLTVLPGIGIRCLLAGFARLCPDTQPKAHNSISLEATVASPGAPQADVRNFRTTTPTATQQPQPAMAALGTNNNSVTGPRPCHVGPHLRRTSVTPATRSRHCRLAATVGRHI